MIKEERKALTTKEVSEVYPTDQGTLANLRWQKKGPKYYKIGRKVLYRPEDIEAWLFSHPVLTIDSLKE